ncbi:MAG: cytochrome c oxidase accessory protein CcoG [Akkermansiaceae bacterium]
MSDKSKSPSLESVSTINDDGSKAIIHPADVSGKFTTLRRITAVILLVVYAVLPWIEINGSPAVFLNIAERRFHLFGITLFANDLWVLFFLISGMAFSLFVLSSVVGRVWCGWYCPYTVFLDHVYRRVERWIEGDAPKRKQLDKAPWSSGKIVKRGFKWFCYVIISLILAHIFLSYFISISELWEHMKTNPKEHLGEFYFVLAFTAVFTFTFGWFREQFCIIMCPYGRFQSALTDDDTITVTYDNVRGDPRGKKRKGVVDTSIGDCVDCKRCISVCPTGIDIRNGIQLECVACSACIDACNDIMVKLDRPKGLIRYDSRNGVDTGKRKIFRARTYLYGVFVLLGAAVLGFTLYKKARPFHAEVSRFTGASYISNEDGVRNLFEFHITNKRKQDMTFSVKGQGAAEIQFSEMEPITITELDTRSFTMGVFTNKADYDGSKNIQFTITSSDGSDMILNAKFSGPNKFMYKQEEEENVE